MSIQLPSTSYKICSHCGEHNIAERVRCKRCYTRLPEQPNAVPRQHYLPLSALLPLLPILVFLCVMVVLFAQPAPPPQPVSLEATISGGNRVIAIDASETPAYRWVVSTPTEFYRVQTTGTTREHDPAFLSYGMTWSAPTRTPNPTIERALTDAEWQSVEQWRTAWCQSPPRLRTSHPDPPFYQVALRCSEYRVVTFRLAPDELPLAIGRLLQPSVQ
jgi:hypothetical protein